MNSSLFWQLVYHEMKPKGEWRKLKRKKFPLPVKIAYIAIIYVAIGAWLTYMNFQKDFQLQYLWFFTLGLPYMVFFFGYGLVKKEWENDTQGWWLTLPYSRWHLITAKYLGASLQALMIILIIYVSGVIFSLYLFLVNRQLTFMDVVNFWDIGLIWMLLMLGISPFVMALGVFNGTVQYTTLRPLAIVFLVLFMGLGSVTYWGYGMSFSGSLFVGSFSDETLFNALHFSWPIVVTMVVSWLCAYLVLRLASYLLDNKLSL